MFFSQAVSETDSSFNACSFSYTSSTCRVGNGNIYMHEVGRCVEFEVPNAACVADRRSCTQFWFWCLRCL